jgi:23S rRNA (uracil1939-C5)-methyltransferase
MTKTVKLKLDSMAHGGAAIGYPPAKAKAHPVFVPFGIPGELVQAEITGRKKHYSRGKLVKILKPSPERVTPRCPHFGDCGGCHWQHLAYEAQTAVIPTIIADQLQRIGKLENVTILPPIPGKPEWRYAAQVEISPVRGGGLGFWSPGQRRVIPVESCDLIRPELWELWQDVDLDLPGLRKLTLRRGDDGALLAALEVNEVEPPELEADFPVSVAIVLPNRTAASLVGDPYSVQTIHGRDFRISPGCYFAANSGMRTAVLTTLLSLANLQKSDTVLELYSGAGVFTAFLAQQAAEVTAIEINEDAVADAVINLDHLDNVAVYQGWVEDVLPTLAAQADVAVVDPPVKGMSETAVHHLIPHAIPKLLYVSSDIATLARDGKQLAKAGYRLAAIQPLDTSPQTFRFHTVSRWEL